MLSMLGSSTTAILFASICIMDFHHEINNDFGQASTTSKDLQCRLKIVCICSADEGPLGVSALCNGSY